MKISVIYKKVNSYFSAPLYVYGIIFLCCIFSGLLYYNECTAKNENIYLAFFSGFSSILMSSIFLDFFINKSRNKETYMIRRIAFIRSANILCFAKSTWDSLVEASIQEYHCENIYSKKYHDLVVDNIKMLDRAPGYLCRNIDLFEYNAKKTIEISNSYMNTFGQYIQPNILSLIAKIQWCGIIQLGLNIKTFYNVYNSIDMDTKNVFPTCWESLENDFNLFKEFEKELLEASYEFPRIREDDKFDMPSMGSPSFCYAKFPRH